MVIQLLGRIKLSQLLLIIKGYLLVLRSNMTSCSDFRSNYRSAMQYAIVSFGLRRGRLLHQMASETPSKSPVISNWRALLPVGVSQRNFRASASCGLKV